MCYSKYMPHQNRKNPHIRRPQTNFQKRFGISHELAPFTHISDATRQVLDDARRAGVDPEDTDFGGVTPNRLATYDSAKSAISGLRKMLEEKSDRSSQNPFASPDPSHLAQIRARTAVHPQTPAGRDQAYSVQIHAPQPGEF